MLKLVDSLLQSGTGLEHGLLGSVDLDLLFGLGVTTHASGTLTNLKGTKADQLNLITLHQSLFDRSDNSGDGLLGILLGQLGLSGDSSNQFYFVHCNIPPHTLYIPAAQAAYGHRNGCACDTPYTTTITHFRSLCKGKYFFRPFGRIYFQEYVRLAQEKEVKCVKIAISASLRISKTMPLPLRVQTFSLHGYRSKPGLCDHNTHAFESIFSRLPTPNPG